jgi:plasmid stabilization system protein ParE
MVRVIWSKTATDDLAAIFDYYDRTSHHAAKTVIDRIIKATGTLELFPRSGRMIPQYQHDNLREIIAGDYHVLYYLPNDETVEIAAILHSSKTI